MKTSTPSKPWRGIPEPSLHRAAPAGLLSAPQFTAALAIAAGNPLQYAFNGQPPKADALSFWQAASLTISHPKSATAGRRCARSVPVACYRPISIASRVITSRVRPSRVDAAWLRISVF